MSDSKNCSSDTIRSVDALISELTSGGKYKYVYFWGHSGSGVGPHVLSQWYRSDFIDDGIQFMSAEHYMMYHKALLFSDSGTAARIVSADNPGKAKALGRQINNFDDVIWLSRRFEIVVQGNVLKFQQNPDILDYLIGTNPRILVEASPQDKIWGIGMDAREARTTVPQKWKGLNLLGFALMEARARLMNSR